MAKIKIKALLGLMRKMIAEGQNVRDVAEEEERGGEGVESLIDRGLRNIAKMIPQYNASLDEVTKLLVTLQWLEKKRMVVCCW